MRNVILTRLGRTFEITGRPPVGNVGSLYTYTFGTAGGSGAITWASTSLGVSGSAFSAGVLSSASLLNGGSYPFTLTAIDGNRQVAMASFVLVVLGSATFRLVTESGNPIVTESGTTIAPQ